MAIGILLRLGMKTEANALKLIELAESACAKSKSTLAAIDKMSHAYASFKKAFICYWTGRSCETNGFEDKLACLIITSLLRGESALKPLALAKREEKVKRYREQAFGRAKGMTLLSWIGLSLFFPFFSGVGLGIIEKGSIILNTTPATHLFASGVIIYTFSAILANSIFYNIDRSLLESLLESMLPFSVALLVFRASSFVSSIL
ncbi:MAG: hypothetical protein ACP5P2_02320 [Candidatus Micrarchaeia archaeon]